MRHGAQPQLAALLGKVVLQQVSPAVLPAIGALSFVLGEEVRMVADLRASCASAAECSACGTGIQVAAAAERQLCSMQALLAALACMPWQLHVHVSCPAVHHSSQHSRSARCAVRGLPGSCS